MPQHCNQYIVKLFQPWPGKSKRNTALVEDWSRRVWSSFPWVVLNW